MTRLRILLPLLTLALLPLAPAGADVDPQKITQASERAFLLETWKENNEWPKKELITLLSHNNVTVRSAALDILEDLAGDDFGFDPWVQPEKIDKNIIKAWLEWADSGSSILEKRTLSIEELEKMMASLMGGSNETQEKITKELIPHKNSALIWIEHYLNSQPDIPEKVFRILRRAEFHLQLQPILGEDSSTIARQLTSGNRNDTIAALESLRQTNAIALPVIDCFLKSKDTLVRETAVDLFITLGKRAGLRHLEPYLKEETDSNILQIAFRKGSEFPTSDFLVLLKEKCFSEDEDLSIASLQSFMEIKSDSEINLAAFQFQEEHILKLLNDSRWRVRDATLQMLYKTKAKLKKSLYEKILQMLEDEDASVRQTAFMLIANSREKGFAPFIEKLAFKQENIFPYALYALIAMNADLSEAMVNTLERLEGSELAILLSLEDHGDSYLTSSSPNKTALKAIECLSKNPSPEVHLFLIKIMKNSMWSKPEHFRKINEFLHDPAISLDQKAEFIDSLYFSDYSESSQQIGALNLPGFIAGDKDPFSSNEGNKPAAERNKENIVKFIEFLKDARSKRNTPGYEALGFTSTTILLKLKHQETLKEIAGEFSQFTPAQRQDIIRNLDISKKNILHLLPIFTQIIKQKEVPLPSYTLSSFFRNLISLIEKSKTKEPKILLLLNNILPTTNSPRNDLIWAAFMEELLDMDDSSDLISHLLEMKNIPDNIKSSLYFYSLVAELSKETSSAQKNILTPSLMGKIKQWTSPESPLTEAQKSVLVCLSEFPTKPDRLETWVKKWISSPHAVNRYNVLQALQIRGGIHFAFPQNESTWNIAPFHIHSYDSSSRTCPADIVPLLENMEKDTDTFVALHASLARLSIHRLCDLEAFTKNLNSLKLIAKALEEDEDEEQLSSEEIKLDAFTDSLRRIYFSRINGFSSDSYSDTYYSQPLQKAKKRTLTEGEKKTLVAFVEAFPDTYLGLDEEEVFSAETSTPPSFSALVRSLSPKTDNTAASQKEQNETPPALTKGNISPEANIPVIFFEKTGCDECARTERYLHDLKKDFPNLEIRKFLITEKAGMEYNALLCSRFLIKNADRHIAPSVFTREGALMRDRLKPENLRQIIAESSRPLLGENANAPSHEWAAADEETLAQSRDMINTTYENFSLGIVILGGLADGINPCAFATLIFFLSYLQIARRSPRELLMTGGAFIIAVYITYFSIGIAFHNILGKLQGLSSIKLGLDIVFTLLALLAAILSFRDAALARKGRLSDMTLQLPGFLKERIRKVSREQTKTRHYIIAAFIAGILISALELACTGQVYAPIIYKIHQGNYSALGMLALYNLAFILPLLLIFWLAYKGMKAQKLIEFQKKHTFGVKLTLGLVFLALAGLILWGAL